MENFPSIEELKEISQKNNLQILKGNFENSFAEKAIKFNIGEELSCSDLFNIIANLGVKIIYIRPTSKFNYIESSILDAVRNKPWYDDIDEWPNEDYEEDEINDNGNLQIRSVNVNINEIITKRFQIEEEKEDSGIAVIYTFIFYYNDIFHFYTIFDNETLLEIDDQIKEDIQQLEDLIIKRDELELKFSEDEKQSDKQKKTEMAEELIMDPIFIKLKNNRMRLNYIAEKYQLYSYQTQSVLDEVQLLSLKRQQGIKEK